MKEKKLQPGETYNTLPVIPGGEGDNLLEGGFQQSATIDQIQELMENTTGVGATENLAEEVIADHDFFRVDNKGHASRIDDGNTGISFGQFTFFSADRKGRIPYAASRETMGKQLQAIAQDYQKSFAVKFNATFDVVKLRAPNHCFDQVHPLPIVMKTDVHFYYLYAPQEISNSFYTYDFFEEHPRVAQQFGFCKETKGDQSYYLKKFDVIHDASETTEIMLRPGDQLYVHKKPLSMQVIIQYTSNEIYELGGVIGYHMHAMGSLDIEEEQISIGGHVLSFTGLRAEQIEITNVTRTWINDNHQIREAYGTDTTGTEIAQRVLGEQSAHLKDKIKAIASTILPDDFVDSQGKIWSSFIKEENNRPLLNGMPGIWKSVIRNTEQRELRINQLVDATKKSMIAKNNMLMELSEQFKQEEITDDASSESSAIFRP